MSESTIGTLCELVETYGFQRVAEDFSILLRQEHKRLRAARETNPTQIKLSVVAAYDSATRIADNLENILWHAH